jgi:hypothetical protein
MIGTTRQKPKILAPNGYRISLNALAPASYGNGLGMVQETIQDCASRGLFPKTGVISEEA